MWTGLWCVLELYCFFVMKPELNGLVLRPFDKTQALTASKLRSTLFNGFDANKASCYLEEDRQHLLAVIESGCGSLSDFNRKLISALDALNKNAKESKMERTMP